MILGLFCCRYKNRQAIFTDSSLLSDVLTAIGEMEKSSQITASGLHHSQNFANILSNLAKIFGKRKYSCERSRNIFARTKHRIPNVAKIFFLSLLRRFVFARRALKQRVLIYFNTHFGSNGDFSVLVFVSFSLQ